MTVTFALTSVIAYHDPDLNYHLNQLQNLQGCGDAGYSYPAPSVQLTTNGVKAAQTAYQYSNAGYSTGVAYQAVAPKVTYAAQPALTYQNLVSHANYAQAPVYTTQTQQQESHGYATSAGLSTAASSGRTVTPLATYAQAPIIAKITAAPLIAKFAIAPSKTTYSTQNLVSQQASYATGSLAKASLNSYGSAEPSGPVVTQVFAAPSARYATSPALRVQQVQVQQSREYLPPRLTAIAAPAQYNQAAPISSLTPVAHVSPAIAQYSTSSVSHVSGPSVAQYAAPAQYSAPQYTQHPAPQQYATQPQYAAAPTVSQYFTPAHSEASASAAQYVTDQSASHVSAPVAHYAAPAVVQYAAPAVGKYAAPAVAQYAAPAVAKYAAPVVQYAAPVAQYAAPSAVQYTPAVAHYSTGAVAKYATGTTSVNAHIAAPAVTHFAGAHVKNAHTEFVENYVSSF